MNTHNIRFYGELEKIIPDYRKYSIMTAIISFGGLLPSIDLIFRPCWSFLFYCQFMEHYMWIIRAY